MALEQNQLRSVAQTGRNVATAGGASVTIGGAVPAGVRRYIMSIDVNDIHASAASTITITNGTDTILVVSLDGDTNPTFDLADDPETPVLILGPATTFTFSCATSDASVSITYIDEP